MTLVLLCACPPPPSSTKAEPSAVEWTPTWMTGEEKRRERESFGRGFGGDVDVEVEFFLFFFVSDAISHAAFSQHGFF